MPCPDIEFRVLGALEVIEDGRKLPLRGKMLHALLAALLVRPRQAITADQLIDDLWGEHAPRAARMSLHNLVSTLRRTLRPELLETMNAGYLLRIDAGQLDAFQFERLISSAAAERARERLRILTEALSLWRGSPLVDVRYESFAQAEIQRLEELHIHALEERLGAELELGAAHTIVPELSALVCQFPFRERLRVLQMVALHRSGRSIEALRSYADWRHLLVETWGLEPSAAVQRVSDGLREHSAPLAHVLARVELGPGEGRTRPARRSRAHGCRPRRPRRMRRRRLRYWRRVRVFDTGPQQELSECSRRRRGSAGTGGGFHRGCNSHRVH